MANSIIITEEQYDSTLDQAFHLMHTHPAIGTSEGETLKLLVTLIEQYESIHYPINENQRVNNN